MFMRVRRASYSGRFSNEYRNQPFLDSEIHGTEVTIGGVSRGGARNRISLRGRALRSFRSPWTQPIQTLNNLHKKVPGPANTGASCTFQTFLSLSANCAHRDRQSKQPSGKPRLFPPDSRSLGSFSNEQTRGLNLSRTGKSTWGTGRDS